MTEMYCDEVNRVREHLDGQCPADEQTLSAVSVLAERLERLKRQSSLFAKITFSPNLQQLAAQATFSVVG
jgi:hypothetical protein